jgi:hypothetical protein
MDRKLRFTTSGRLRAALAAAIGALILLVRDHAPWPWLVDLMPEIGFALLVAVFIYLIFEVFAQADEEQIWRKRIEDITGNVFYGVLRRSLPESLLREANELVLSQVFIRKSLSLEYVLEDDTFEDEDGKAASYVRVMAAIRFRIENISDTPQKFPLRVALPNPVVQGLKEKTDVFSFSYVQHGAQHSVDLTKAKEMFRLNLAESQRSHVICEAEPILLEKGERAEVEYRYAMAKENEDAENFETLYPSDSIRLMIVDRGSRRIGASSHHPSELECLTLEGGPVQYRLNRYLLPHQGVLIWWKKAKPVQ